MYDLVVHATGKEVHTNRYYGRDIAEMYFEMAYDCDNVCSVELVSAETGEILHMKCKG